MRTGLVEASITAAAGKGTNRVFAFRDIVALRTVRELLEQGVSLQKVRRATRALKRCWPKVEAPLSSMILVTDGDDLFTVLPQDEARETVLSLVLRPGELAWRRFVVDVGRIAGEVREALAVKSKQATKSRHTAASPRRAAGGRR